MTRRRQHVGGRLPTSPLLREPDGAAGGDFAWPPPADDPDGCGIVLLDGGGNHASPLRIAAFDDGPGEAFPDVDLDTALDQFADPDPAPAAPAIATPAPARAIQAAAPKVSRLRGGGMRTIVAVCIGASLALAPAPGLRHVPEARPLPGPAKVEPHPPAPRSIAAGKRVRAATAPSAEPRPVEVVPGDEDHIRATLADLQAAYARLDADATRDIWPSVDVDALGLAFGGLKSQELRFEHCDVTVNGGHARADCTGEAVYVPRLGGRAASSAARAWTFRLTRMRERWMISSARAI